MFIALNQVRMHDTDMAGILYFPRQFRFAHDALEDFLAAHGVTFEHVFHKQEFVFVIVHAEADYLAPLTVGNHLEVHLNVDSIGTSSFTISYAIFKKDTKHQKSVLVGKAKTVHVTLDALTRKKIPIPSSLKEILES